MCQTSTKDDFTLDITFGLLIASWNRKRVNQIIKGVLRVVVHIFNIIWTLVQMILKISSLWARIINFTNFWSLYYLNEVRAFRQRAMSVCFFKMTIAWGNTETYCCIANIFHMTCLAVLFTDRQNALILEIQNTREEIFGWLFLRWLNWPICDPQTTCSYLKCGRTGDSHHVLHVQLMNLQ